MSTHDTTGREYARLSALKAGDVVTLDTGFTCRRAGPATLEQGAGELCFQCSAGNHYLGGQLGEDGEHLIGIYPPA